MNKQAPKNVSIELATNITDLKNKVVKDTDVDIIVSQTGIDDKIEIERVLLECQSDISRTILKLMSLKSNDKEPKEPTVFDQIREILNDKEQLYHDHLSKKNP